MTETQAMSLRERMTEILRAEVQRMIAAGNCQYETLADAALSIALEEAARVAEVGPYTKGGIVCGCSEGLSNHIAAAIRALAKEGE